MQSSTTLEELERRVSSLEKDMGYFKRLESADAIEETPAMRGRRILDSAKRNRAKNQKLWKRAFEGLGVRRTPVGIEKLHQMMKEAGLDPNDNQFSRGIIEMRDE